MMTQYDLQAIQEIRIGRPPKTNEDPFKAILAAFKEDNHYVYVPSNVLDRIKTEENDWVPCERLPDYDLNPVEGLIRDRETKKVKTLYKPPNANELIFDYTAQTDTKIKHRQIQLKTLISEQFVLKRKRLPHERVILHNKDRLPRLKDIEVIQKDVFKANKKAKLTFTIDKSNNTLAKVILIVGDRRYFSWVKQTKNEPMNEVRLNEAQDELARRHTLYTYDQRFKGKQK